MSLRSRAREIVLQVLYQDDMNRDRSTEEDLPFIKNRLHNNGNIVEFAKELVDGVRARRTDIDQELGKVAENWKISRMAATDRNVLRLGAFEILFYETPDKVAVNEAIELAKRYGSELSPNFINGILDRLIKSKNDPAVEPDQSSPEMNSSADPSAVDSPSVDSPSVEAPSIDSESAETDSVETTSIDPAAIDPASIDPVVQATSDSTAKTDNMKADNVES